jgi:hypothetical protein
MWLYFLIAISANVDLLGGPILLFRPQYSFQLHLFCLLPFSLDRIYIFIYVDVNIKFLPKRGRF